MYTVELQWTHYKITKQYRTKHCHLSLNEDTNILLFQLLVLL